MTSVVELVPRPDELEAEREDRYRATKDMRAFFEPGHPMLGRQRHFRQKLQVAWSDRYLMSCEQNV